MAVTAPAVAAFFALPPQDAAAAITAIFATDAHVNDERQDHHGLDAIIEWWHATNANTPFASRLLSVDADGDRAVAAAEVSGSFPGSPVVLRYRFRLHQGRIADLEITP